MRIVPDTLIGRIILILIIGTLIIASDISMIYTLFLKDEQTMADWLLVFVAILFCLILIGYIISRQLVLPLKNLSEGAKRFSTEMNTQPVPVTGPKEVREAAQSFNQMQEHIQRFVEERMQLIAAISHDLRTPLTRLRLRVESLTDEQQKIKALTDIEDITTMVQSTLAFVREDTQKEEAVKTNIATLIRSVCDDTTDFYGPAHYSGMDYCVLICRPLAIKRALTNVIENAVKYGKRAEVQLIEQNEVIKITVSDQGPGIPEMELKKVFIPFYRVDKSRSRETGGVGLGLSVARTLIQAQGGSIRLENNKLKGLLVEILF